MRLEGSRSTPGNGLGLSLVRAVAKLHDGSVWLEDNQLVSVATGHPDNPGLKVIIELPLASGAGSEPDRDMPRLLPAPVPNMAVATDAPRDLGKM